MKNRVIVFGKIAIAVLVIIIFIIINISINGKNNKTFVPIPDSNNCAYQVEKIEIDGDDLIITGWFFELKSMRNAPQNIPNKKLGIVLVDVNAYLKKEDSQDSEEISGLQMDVVQQNRQDVNEYFRCEYDYSHCGFVAKIPKSDLNYEFGEYQVVFKPDYSGREGILSSYFVNKGVLSQVDPSKYLDLDVTGTDLEKIVKSGVCVASIPEYHIVVYQYLKKIYWIAEKNEFLFSLDGNTGIVYMMDTTQFSKLPSERIESGDYWNNISDSFEKYEITNEINCGRYRVSARDIPTDMSIVDIETGQYINGEYLWYSLFRPVYTLLK